MTKLRKPVYTAAGFNTVSLGSGRKEFHPKKPRPGLEHYIETAGKGVIAQIEDPGVIDEGVISNFMAARFNKQGNLAAMMPIIHPSLEYKPHTRVEGACGSGGLGLVTAMKTVLAETADVVLTLGTEVQNTYKAIYGADILAGAGHFASERKAGHAYFFPNKFSERAGAMYERYGYEHVRRAMARWYEQAILSARTCPEAQEYHNTVEDLFALGMTPPNPAVFVPHLNVYDCSKVSDGASALLFCSEEGLKKAGIPKSRAVRVVGWGTAVADITRPPEDLTALTTTAEAVRKAYACAGLSPKDIGVLEVHDCFTVGGLLMLEAAGFCDKGESLDFVLEGRTSPRGGELPTNARGGLIGFGHYTGGTGVRQAVDLLHLLTGTAGDSQVQVDPRRPYGLMISMGGNDRTVTAMIFGPAD
jgi:acetyl-CoA C-acetyltransferase/acetyl-CoA acyltransferase